MTGTGNGEFSPYESTTRGMIVTILWRMDGESEESGDTFADIKTDAYYHDAVIWASNHHIVTGYNESTFGADDAMTREQMTAIMYRYAVYKGYDVSKKAPLNNFDDAPQVSGYAVEALEWGCANGIIHGTSDSTLSPEDDVLRCQAAAIIQRFCTVYSDASEPNEKDNAETTPTAFDTEAESGRTDGQGAALGGNSGGSGSGGGSGRRTPDATAEPVRETEKPISEDKSTRIIAGNETAVPGEYVQVAVEIKNNPGILGMTLTAYYDETKCTLESVTNGEAFEGVLDFVPSKTLGSGARFVWGGLEITEDKIKDGKILLMDFHVAENAADGRIPIAFKCFGGDAVNNDLEPVTLQIADGSITVQANQ